MLIQVKSVERNKTKDGKKDYLRVTTDDDELYFLFNMGLAHYFQEGGKVNIEAEEEDKWKKIVGVKEQVKETSKSRNGARDGMITRLACLKPAAVIMAARIAKGDEIKSSDLFKLAGLMEKWANGELDSEKPDASKQEG